jgi:hypothetical protein
MILTLRDWQKKYKDPRRLILQASATDGSDSWQPFPIGMQYNYKYNYHLNEEIQIGKHENNVLLSITPNTDAHRRPRGINRNSIINQLKKNGIENVVMHHSDYFKSLPTYKFVISPEGNGIDCHRHYEALIAGCIPIIEHNPLVSEKYRGCPILFTKDYKEITHEYLEKKYKQMLDQTFNFSCLFIDNYDDTTQKYIKNCGNFWMNVTTNSIWYPVF